MNFHVIQGISAITLYYMEIQFLETNYEKENISHGPQECQQQKRDWIFFDKRCSIKPNITIIVFYLNRVVTCLSIAKTFEYVISFLKIHINLILPNKKQQKLLCSTVF